MPHDIPRHISASLRFMKRHLVVWGERWCPSCPATQATEGEMGELGADGTYALSLDTLGSAEKTPSSPSPTDAYPSTPSSLAETSRFFSPFPPTEFHDRSSSSYQQSIDGIPSKVKQEGPFASSAGGSQLSLGIPRDEYHTFDDSYSSSITPTLPDMGSIPISASDIFDLQQHCDDTSSFLPYVEDSLSVFTAGGPSTNNAHDIAPCYVPESCGDRLPRLHAGTSNAGMSQFAHGGGNRAASAAAETGGRTFQPVPPNRGGNGPTGGSSQQMSQQLTSGGSGQCSAVQLPFHDVMGARNDHSPWTTFEVLPAPHERYLTPSTANPPNFFHTPSHTPTDSLHNNMPGGYNPINAHVHHVYQNPIPRYEAGRQTPVSLPPDSVSRRQEHCGVSSNPYGSEPYTWLQ